MDWGQIGERLGLPAAIEPDLLYLAVAALCIAAASGLGYALAPRLARAVASGLRRWMGGRATWEEGDLRVLIRRALGFVLLAVLIGPIPFTPLALLLMAAALALFAATAVFRFANVMGGGFMTAATVAVLTFVLTAVTALGGLQPVTAQLETVGFTIGSRHFSLLSIINFAIVALLLYLVARFANRVLGHSINRLHAFDASQKLLFQKLAGIAVIVVAGLIGIDLLGIDLTALAVFSGALGLAVGFGLQKTLGNLLAGLILLMDRSIKPGDVIVVGDTFGAVNKIGVRAVSVVTRDGKEHLIPNEQLMTEPVENWSYSNRNVRVHIPVGVSYDADLALAQKLMVEAAQMPARALKNPKPTVWLKDFGESSIDHDILVWIADPEAGVGNIRSEILNRLWELFKENGVEIPFPQRDLHIRSVSAPEAVDLPARAGLGQATKHP